MSNIPLQDPAIFSKTFLDEYCKNGLGSGFSKRDVDVLVFFLLLQDERYTLPEDIFIACRELKLSETKVRRLYQDAQLRYMQYDEEEAKKKFVAVVESGAIEKKRGETDLYNPRTTFTTVFRGMGRHRKGLYGYLFQQESCHPEHRYILSRTGLSRKPGLAYRYNKTSTRRRRLR